MSTVYAYRDGYRLRKSGRIGYTVYAPDDGYIGYAEFGHFETIDKLIEEYENGIQPQETDASDQRDRQQA